MCCRPWSWLPPAVAITRALSARRAFPLQSCSLPRVCIARGHLEPWGTCSSIRALDLALGWPGSGLPGGPAFPPFAWRGQSCRSCSEWAGVAGVCWAREVALTASQIPGGSEEHQPTLLWEGHVGLGPEPVWPGCQEKVTRALVTLPWQPLPVQSPCAAPRPALGAEGSRAASEDPAQTPWGLPPRHCHLAQGMLLGAA